MFRQQKLSSQETGDRSVNLEARAIPKRHIQIKFRLSVFVLLLGLMLILTACPGDDPPPVDPTVNSVIISPKPNSMKVGEVANLSATVDGSTNLTDTSVVWASSNTGFATVNNGAVTGIAKGSVTITATSNFNPEKLDSVSMTITEDDPPPSPNLEVSPGNAEVGVGGGVITFTATRTSISEAVTWTLTGPGSPSTGSGDTFVYTPPTTFTTDSATLTASAGGLSKQITIAIKKGSVISAVEIKGYTDTQVRQGAGFIEVTVTGNGLTGANNVKLLEANIDGTSDTSNNTSATFFFTIPNGANIGQQTLQFSTNTDPALSKTEVLEITPIVFSLTGSDSNKGTFSSPFKTLEASYLAGDGDILHLTNGTHVRELPFTIPQGVTLEGESRESTIVQAKTAGSTDGFSFESEAEIRNLTLKTFAITLFTDANDDVVLDNTTVSNSTSKAFYVLGDSNVEIQGSLFEKNQGDNIVVADHAKLTVTNSQFKDNGYTGLWITGSSTDNPSVNLDDVTIRGNGIQDDTWGGIQISAGEIKVRNSTITEDKGNGIVIDNFSGGTPQVIDFGTSTDSGNNTIENNGQLGENEWQINDSRNTRLDPDGPIATFLGSSIGGLTNLGSIKTGFDSNSNGVINYWIIQNSFNRIRLSE
jgi:Right handed beta helix region/Bacterial Ig-like domain (group 2)